MRASVEAALLPFRLGAEQRGASLGDEFGGGDLAAGTPGHTDTCRQCVALQIEVFVDVRNDRFDATLEPLLDNGLLGVAAQDNELIAFQAGQRVATPNSGVQALGDRSKDGITPLLAPRLGHDGETVKANEE